MATYYPVLENAVSGLDDKSPKARREVYDLARSALIQRLRQIEPPVPEDYIVRESIALNEAIEKLEAKLSRPVAERKDAGPITIEAAAVRVSEAAPAVPPPEPPPSPPESPAPRFTARKRPVVGSPAPAPDTAAPHPPAPSAVPEAAPPVRALVRVRAAVERPRATDAKAGALTPRDEPAGAGVARVPTPAPDLSPSPPAPGVDAPVPDAPPRPAADPVAPQAGGRRGNRVKVAPAEVRPPERTGIAVLRPGSWPVRTRTALLVAAVPLLGIGAAALALRVSHGPDVSVRAPAPPSDVAGKTGRRADDPDSDGPAATEGDPEGSAAAPGTGPVGQRAALLVDAPDDPQRIKVYTGTVNWRTETRSIGLKQTSAVTAVADVAFPGAGLTMTMLMQSNREPQLSASHQIEFRFTPGPGSPVGNVKAVGTLAMRRDDDTRLGIPLTGVTVPISGNDFLVGLTRGRAEGENMRLVADNAWFDLPVLFASGTVGKVTFEKGTSGQQIWTATAGAGP